MMKLKQPVSADSCGFTLIEMIVVIALIGILSALAMPSFQNSIIRKQVEAALPLADIAKGPIANTWKMDHTFLANNTAAALPAADKIVSNLVTSLTIKDGAINITFGNRAHRSIAGKILTLRPAIVADAPVVPITWLCGKAEAPNKMTAHGSDQTTIPDDFLPLECRKSKA